MPDDVTVLVPDPLGPTGLLMVVDLGQLVDYLADGQSLEDAVSNAGIDQINEDDLAAGVARVGRLNATGDAEAYWDRT